MKTIKKDRHKRITLTCNHCYSVFEREARKQVAYTTIHCKSCIIRQRTRVQSFPTRILKEIINNNGITDFGTCYESRLDDIKEEYYRRQEIKMQKEFDKRATFQ